MNRNKVSIITPVYNAEKYLPYTIDSVLSQTYQDWELILIDDASSDISKKIIQQYRKLDNRIKVIENKVNYGVAISRNIGIENAKGRYIAFLDSDDWWEKDKLEKQLEFMEKNNYSFTFTNYKLIDGDNSDLGKTRYSQKKVDYKDLLKNNSIGCSTVILDRKMIENISMPKIEHEDFATWLDILKTGNNGYGLDLTLTNYRIVKGSLSSNKIKCMKYRWNVYRKNQQLSIKESTVYISYYVMSSIAKRL